MPFTFSREAQRESPFQSSKATHRILKRSKGLVVSLLKESLFTEQRSYKKISYFIKVLVCLFFWKRCSGYSEFLYNLELKRF